MPDINLKETIFLAGEWFLSNADEQKFLQYELDARTGKYSDAVNELRKIGALWSIAEIAAFTGDDRYDDLIEAGLRYFEQFIMHYDGFAYLDVHGKRKLGYNALLIMAILSSEPGEQRQKLAEELADGILHQQQEDGSYKTYFFSNQNTGTDYYPGEASLALATFYEKTGDKRYLEALRKSFPHYRDYWRANRTTAFIPWHTQALVKLHALDPDEEYRDFVFEMNDWILTRQQTAEKNIKEEYIGGFQNAPGNSTAGYLEGLNDAYALAMRIGDTQRTQRYGEAIRLGTRFVHSTQYTNSNLFGLSAPLDARILGGVKQSPESPMLRVDYNQHATAAFLKAHRNNLAP